MKNKMVRFIFTMVLTVLWTLSSVGLASAASVDPVFVAGNPSCTSLGYDFGFKVDPPNAGTYSIDGVNTVTVETDGVYFDWSSTLGMDAVISKGGPNANVYIYDPPAESFGDTDLHSPINPNNGNPFGLSHIEFCYDYELTASKTAGAEYTRTYTWTIDKSVSPDTHSGFTGDSFVSDYEVFVDQTVVDSAFAVTGSITINNPTPYTVGFSVSDLVNGTAATVECPTNSLLPGESTVCTYSADFGDTNPGDGTNTATITSNNTNVDGVTASDGYAFGEPTTVVGYPTINVTDTVEGALGSASGDKTFSYSHTFTCDEDEGENPNTATIDETGQSDNALVTVNCYELQVTKDADTSFDRTYDWSIDKSADQTNLTLSLGQQFTVNYSVLVDVTGYTDNNWAVSGNIQVSNPASINANLNSVSDLIEGIGAVNVDCGVTFPYVLTAGGVLNCTYSSDLPNADDRLNTATATLQNYDYDTEGNATPNGTTDFSGTANVDFDNAAMTEYDECIDVSDTLYGDLGTVCADEAPKTFNYSYTVGPYSTCGEYTVDNTASFVTNDSGSTGSDNWSIPVNVPCANGCTLTQGYWKTHSQEGPAPYDDAWTNLSFLQEDTPFFISGKTWYTVFWTPPQGNAYYNLAHQYMAAKLNILNGASTTPAVVAAISSAETFFWTKLPSSTLTKAQRTNVLAWAATLDAYNNGLTGPGHCSEQ